MGGREEVGERKGAWCIADQGVRVREGERVVCMYVLFALTVEAAARAEKGDWLWRRAMPFAA